jgi:hypothetical protein
MTLKLSELIREVKPRAALLTTHTLSLSFFEAAVLSEFKKIGCHDIVLLVDEQEANKSFAEARSMGAGRTYRFLPVASPGGGFFHPKIAYLECKNDDVLVISREHLTRHPYKNLSRSLKRPLMLTTIRQPASAA